MQDVLSYYLIHLGVVREENVRVLGKGLGSEFLDSGVSLVEYAKEES